MKNYLRILLVIGFLFISGCNVVPTSADNAQGKLKVVATTTLVADVVRQVGADRIELQTLLPVGADPHAFEPSPQDIAKIAGADIVFANGAGLEIFLDEMIANAGGNAQVVHVSEGIDFLEFSGDDHDHEPDAAEDEGHTHEGIDPHVWFDPHNVMLWVQNINETLAAADPDNAAYYAENAQAYQQELTTLDTWIKETVSQVPAANRVLVTDHTVLGYFARQYGFTQVGAVIPAYSTAAQPSAQELAALENAVLEHNVHAIFVGNTVNPALAQQVAQDTGVRLSQIYTGSLTDSEGDAPDYLSFIKYNVITICEALK